jgi:hypothetical protein
MFDAMKDHFVKKYFQQYQSKWDEILLVVNLQVMMKGSNVQKKNLIVKDCINSDVVEIWNQVIPNAFITISNSESTKVVCISYKKDSLFKRWFKF